MIVMYILHCAYGAMMEGNMSMLYTPPPYVCSSRWNAIVVDGHDIAAIIAAFDNARACVDKPTALIAKTYKGYAHDNAAEGISDQLNWHGKPLGARGEEIITKIKAATSNLEAFIPPKAPAGNLPENEPESITLSSPPAYGADDKV